MKLRPRPLLAGTLCLCLIAPRVLGALPLWQTPPYVQAIELARAGDPSAALTMLAAERAKGPLSAPLWNDYLTLLCWSGQSPAALALLAGREGDLRPDTLRLLANAARDAKNFTLAEQLYRRQAGLAPRADIQAALAMVLAEAGRPTDGLAALDAASPHGEQDTLVLTRARAYVLMLTGDYARTLDYLRDARDHFPADAELDQRYRAVLTRLGVPMPSGDLQADDRTALYRFSGLGQKVGSGQTAWVTEVYKRALPPVAFFNDYLVMLCRQGRAAQALLLAQGHDRVLTSRTLAQLQRAVDEKGDDAQRALVAQWRAKRQNGNAIQVAAQASDTPVPDAVLQEARERALLLIGSNEWTQALVWLMRWQPRYATDPVLNDAYMTVLEALGLVAQQQTLAAAAPMRPGRSPAKEAAFNRSVELGLWGKIQAGQEQGLARHAQTDQALALNAAWLAAPDLNDDMRRQGLDLRVQLLAQRLQWRQAVDLYRQHAALAWSAPAQAAVAGAMLALRQPREAEGLYRAALAQAPQAEDAIEWQIGLAYALLESGQYRHARQFMSGLLASVPRDQIDSANGLPTFNPDYQTVAYHQAMMTAYLEGNADAAHQLDDLLADAPYDNVLRQGQGENQLLRGWPRQAGETFRRIQVDQQPESARTAVLGQADVALELMEFGQAGQILNALATEQPDGTELQERQLRLADALRPQLVVESGHDMGGNQGVADQNAWDSLTRVYSQAFGHWRLFGQHQLQTADFTNVTPTQQARYETLGMGGQHRGQYGTGEFGLFSEIDGRDRQGGFAGYDWTPDDRWTLGLRFEQNSAEVPLPAHLDNVAGNLLRGSLQYRPNDDNQWLLQASQLDFSDGNRRQSFALSWDRHWLTGPLWQLGTLAAVATSHNQQVAQAMYFNPLKDLETSLTVTNDWTLWRWYDSSWHQRLGLTRGRYYQATDGTDNLWGLSVEQSWQWGHGNSLTYGLTRSSHPYDGSQSLNNRAYLNLDWRFR
ncbi:poly-beta-1,6 N-acetyl-D-glucosamine export porin PgaA [Paludibacterium purpuratum]|uniref:Poly-beta-1,6 N-acetyl-D-glucosamine export porin PgaA n=1 Tax=Paludibacterium purpuratum TaxID=1144873 RepID=A0A4R7B376_9NEIS|nr:poly-beta-1,6 N-acetyl-D-glucosamine export porin PgaA [Paludibacterium purpuratum]TDR76624.1 poly-beta-1,6 N-acetyl-D-glucosamine export porin PgaA [Paludibacterium purpuratum]